MLFFVSFADNSFIFPIIRFSSRHLLLFLHSHFLYISPSYLSHIFSLSPSFLIQCKPPSPFSFFFFTFLFTCILLLSHFYPSFLSPYLSSFFFIFISVTYFSSFLFLSFCIYIVPPLSSFLLLIPHFIPLFSSFPSFSY